MAGNDPFAEGGDDPDRTVIRPNPGGRRGGTAAPAPQSQPAPAPPGGFDQGGGYGQGGGASADAFGVPQGRGGAGAGASGGGSGDQVITLTGMNALIASASPLFALVSRIRNRAQHVDPDKLRQSVVAEVRAFESRALAAQIDPQQVKVARYALCATIDDVVLNTPWGGQSNWALQSMVGTFHRETVGGDRFYDLLARLEKDPAANLELLEFLYVCLSLGFEGRLRVEDRGSDKHLQIRNSLARIIRGQRGSPEYDLSPHWKGINKPHRARSLWKPFWIALGVTCVLLAGTYSTLAFLLGRQSGPVIGTIVALTTSTPAKLARPAPPVEPPPEVKPAAFDEVVVAGEEKKSITIVEFLKDEIAAKQVEVKETPTELKVFLVGAGLFKSGSDQLEDGLEVVIGRVGEALGKESGPIIVAGYTDNVPLSGRGRFKDNVALSQARAQQVAKLLAAQLGGYDRLTAEGHGEENPIADNATAEGRAQNRRVEIILVKQEGT